MFARKLFTIGLLALAVIILLTAALPAVAQAPPGSSKMYPWNVQGYQGYNEPRGVVRAPETSQAPEIPLRYTVTIARLPQEPAMGNPNTVSLMAHLPEDAEIWVEDMQSTQKGMIRNFVSPPLTPGKDYYYTVRVKWLEDGKWVSQTRAFPVVAGEMQCLDLVPADSPTALEQEKASLARLDPEDRKLAEEQKYCAVQNDKRLGSMGTPVKIMVKGQPVFLCCDGCKMKAESNPDQTLAKVEALKAKNK